MAVDATAAATSFGAMCDFPPSYMGGQEKKTHTITCVRACRVFNKSVCAERIPFGRVYSWRCALRPEPQSTYTNVLLPNELFVATGDYPLVVWGVVSLTRDTYLEKEFLSLRETLVWASWGPEGVCEIQLLTVGCRPTRSKFAKEFVYANTFNNSHSSGSDQIRLHHEYFIHHRATSKMDTYLHAF